MTCDVILKYTLFLKHILNIGARGSVVVKVLGYKPEGRGFDTPRDDLI
jgi:hypothetical protein